MLATLSDSSPARRDIELHRRGYRGGEACPLLRSMRETDADPIARIISRAMNPAEGRQAAETFALHFSCKAHGIDDGRAYFVLAADDVLKGIVGLHQYSWGPPENVWLAWFAVEPKCRRHGLGALLMKSAIERAKQLRFMKLFVETYSTPEFADARAFYRAHGFQTVGNVRNYLPCGGDMVVFLKDLTSHV